MSDLHEALDEIEEVIEQMENANTMLQNGKALPSQIHVDALRGLLPKYVAQLRAAHKRATGRT